ncbi:MAG TPA: hypothetical protein V6D07_14655 [Trichocoleus sp.]
MNLTGRLITIHNLKQQVETFWELLHETTAAVTQPENLKPEVRRLFGDLRRKHTWEKAAAHFYTQWVINAAGDGDIFFKLMDPSGWEPWQREIRFLILEALTADKYGIELLRGAYEYLVENSKTELANGLLELAREAGGFHKAPAIQAFAGVG